MSAVGIVVVGTVGYAFGSFPSADLATRIATQGAVDLRFTGSGNPGATNAAKVLGTKWGVAVLIADMAKGAAAGFVGMAVGGSVGGYLAATLSVFGHIFPLWSRFRGGKGVATSAGACLAVFPIYFPIDLAVAAIGAVAARRAERATQISGGMWVVATVLWWVADLPNAWGPEPAFGLFGFAAASTVLILGKFAQARRAAASVGVAA